MKRKCLYVLCFMIVSLMAVANYSCNKGNDKDTTAPGNEKPSQIPGMGNAAGTPQGEAFKLPAGISLKGDIVGNEDGVSGQDCVFDGQGFNVVVKIKLHRDTGSSPIQVVFPAGLVITTASEGFQHGLLIEKVLVTIPPVQPGSGGSDCQVSLMMLCLNAARKPSSASAKYKFATVTNSELIKDFIKKLSGKKISFSAYPAGNNDDYFLNEDFIQEALWNITDGEGLTKKDLEFIQGLPNK
ncbi:hypothetical protein [Niastella sp. OAS944]|uniref:hypothetical protein n=1 Tax=Niastella sp. OAS944 TaxID=2664089 RepID=UPI00347CED80|nr:hypothetical protein [Chitinophagaceae bacterium OAS944]